jgi:hypothetical protein
MLPCSPRQPALEELSSTTNRFDLFMLTFDIAYLYTYLYTYTAYVTL